MKISLNFYKNFTQIFERFHAIVREFLVFTNFEENISLWLGATKHTWASKNRFPFYRSFKVVALSLFTRCMQQKIILIYLVCFDASEKPGKIRKFLNCDQKIPNIFF